MQARAPLLNLPIEEWKQMARISLTAVCMALLNLPIEEWKPS